MLAEQHSQGSPLSKVVENNFGTRNGIEQNGLMLPWCEAFWANEVGHKSRIKEVRRQVNLAKFLILPISVVVRVR